MSATKHEFVRHLSKVVLGAIKEVQRGHGGELIPDSVAKRVAAQLWADTTAAAHANDGDWIRHIRGALGCTQTELATMLGTSQVTVARWETGASKPARYYRLAIENLARSLRNDNRSSINSL